MNQEHAYDEFILGNNNHIIQIIEESILDLNKMISNKFVINLQNQVLSQIHQF